MTFTLETMHTQTPTPTQILVIHINLHLATVTAPATPRLFWLVVTAASMYPK